MSLLRTLTTLLPALATIPFTPPLASTQVLAAAQGTGAPGLESEPLVTDRPDFTESAVTVAPRRVQVEAGYTLGRSGEARDHSIGEVLGRVGLSQRVELRLGFNSFQLVEAGGDHESGFQDLALGLKLKLLSGSERPRLLGPAVALLVGGALPTGSEGVGAGGGAAEAKLALAWPLGSRFSLGSNLNVGWLDLAEASFVQFSGSLSLGASLSERLGAYLEAFGFASGDDAGLQASFLNGGLTLGLGANLQLDGRAGFGFDDPRPNYFAGLGFAVRW